NPGSLMTEPDRQDLWNRHEHRKEGHASQQATKQCVGVESMSRWGNRIWKHSRLPGQIFWLNAGRIVFYPQAWKQSNFGLILGGTPNGQNGRDCTTNDACRGPDRGGKSKEEAEVASGRQACNEEARYRCLKGVVEDGGAVAALDASYKIAGFQKRNTLQVDLIAGRVEDVVDLRAVD